MPELVTPTRIEEIVMLGFDRVEKFNKVTQMMFRSYVPEYYRKDSALDVAEPINLVFNTIRAYVPNLVMKNPITKVTTPFTDHKGYAELLGLGLDDTARQIRLKDELRAWITNALFGWGIMRTGIKATGEMLNVDDVWIDNGQVYARNVSLSNFGFDPTCTRISEAKMLWDRVTVPRQVLLDTDGYNHDVVRALPSSPSNTTDKLADMTRSRTAKFAMTKLQDEVDVVQVYVPEVESWILMGDPKQKRQGKYINVAEYNGPKEGPYTFLSFAPPVDQSPFPVPPVSIWYELARLANRVFNKMVRQFESQKDVGLYNPAQMDTVSQIEEAITNDWVPTMDPKGIQVVSFGGQNPNNERFLSELNSIYNTMAGNPELISGSDIPGGKSTTATAVQALQNNASISIEDSRDMVYDGTAEIQRKIAWHLHTDPFIELPLTKRKTGGEEVQVWLTPEQRMGDFLDYTFKIVARSMTKMDPMVKSKRIIEFSQILSGLAQTAIALITIGQPFNVQRAATQIAFNMGIEDIAQDIFDDPEWQQKMQVMMMLGPQNQGKAEGGGSGGSLAGAVQNKGNAMARPISTPTQDFRQDAQSSAAVAQSINQGVV
jgi:hypothetical protein